MSFYTNEFIIYLRNLGRVIGVNKLVSKFLKRGYEEKYQSKFLAFLKSGYIVWDIGANTGYYTKIFSQKVGEKGHVYAFEPSPRNFKKLKDNCNMLNNITLFQIALGDKDGKVFLKEGMAINGTTDRIVENGNKGIGVAVFSANTIINKNIARLPDAIKIDVEGYEFEVLSGFGNLLSNPKIKLIGVEIHFRILKERGMLKVPRKIEELLNKHNFSIRWTDSSHLIAFRK